MNKEHIVELIHLHFLELIDVYETSLAPTDVDQFVETLYSILNDLDETLGDQSGLLN